MKKVFITANDCELGEKLYKSPLFNVVPYGMELVKDIPSSDFVSTPYAWNFYTENNCINDFMKIYKEVENHQKKLIVFQNGDYTANIPVPGLIIVQPSAYKSRNGELEQNLFSISPFISDFVKLYCQGQQDIRQKQKKPVVGFCGQAAGNYVDSVKRYSLFLSRQIFFKLRILNNEPPPFETTTFRKKVLSHIKSEPQITTNYLLRRKYRAGYTVPKKDPYHPTRLEFVKNILDSDYTVCIRGGGNFSVRFYEALALGRIPIFINTDCVLPYDNILNYKDFCVWVEKDEIKFIGEKVLSFHNSLSQSQFIEVQKMCRNIWLEYLSKEGYWSHFHLMLSEVL